MKKILLSTTVVFFALGSIIIGSTGAFFSDVETSGGNTFTAGAVDLEIANQSYYNGVLNPGTTWVMKNLTTIEKFFDFLDLKPGDVGEDTISFRVDDNDAYLCANVLITSNDDNGLTEPEALVDTTDGPGNGELVSKVNFIWWADDGDNVLEDDEVIITEGPIGVIGTGGELNLTLADSTTNVWTGVAGPVPGGQILHLGKAWCFGEILAVPLVQDGFNNVISPANTSGGVSCNGSFLDNATQTDSLTADLEFNAVQARHNPDFVCSVPGEPATFTVTKVVVQTNGGNNVIEDFDLFVSDGITQVDIVSGVPVVLPAGTYTIDETNADGYAATFSGDCNPDGTITIDPINPKTCTVTNTELPASITLNKNVTGNAPLEPASSFVLTIDDDPMSGGVINLSSGTTIPVLSNQSYTIDEVAFPGYTFDNIFGDTICPEVLGGTVTLSEGQNITCTIVNIKDE